MRENTGKSETHTIEQQYVFEFIAEVGYFINSPCIMTPVEVLQCDFHDMKAEFVFQDLHNQHVFRKTQFLDNNDYYNGIRLFNVN